MARIQILELPAGDNDDRPPFALVIDQVTEATATSLGMYEAQGLYDPMHRLLSVPLAEQLGARAVLCFEETIDIPANEVPVDPDGHPLKIRVEPDFDQFRQQVQDEIRKANADVTRALRAGIDHAKTAYQDSTPRPYTAGAQKTRDKDRELRDANEWTERLAAERDEARTWARHGYEIGQRHCGWADHGVAPAWLTERSPARFDSCEHLKRATEYDEALTRVRALHQPVDFYGRTICAECSAYDAQGLSTDNAPVLYTDCATTKALGPSPADTQRQPPEQQ